MPQFQYLAVDEFGEEFRGQVLAWNPEDARGRLSQLGLRLRGISEPWKTFVVPSPPSKRAHVTNLMRWWTYSAIAIPILCAVATAIVTAVMMHDEFRNSPTMTPGESVVVTLAISVAAGMAIGAMVAVKEAFLFGFVWCVMWVCRLGTNPDD